MTVIKEIISNVTGVNYSLNATIHSLLCPSMVSQKQPYFDIDSEYKKASKKLILVKKKKRKIFFY